MDAILQCITDRLGLIRINTLLKDIDIYFSDRASKKSIHTTLPDGCWKKTLCFGRVPQVMYLKRPFFSLQNSPAQMLCDSYFVTIVNKHEQAVLFVHYEHFCPTLCRTVQEDVYIDA